ncbi:MULTISPECIES: cbb3-type cytochrome oxidase assembly protein CcoS [Psychrobacter]|uniref:cbb3-type cytochrome oxidase assembly protein CcoS n=1 Tax=Psychrobacter TaxID=497 RepID=UPI000EBF150F|nr:MULTISPECIES: cbb3-type cytochrome oxidase assembly protein CcoS [Psychrobacter]HCT73023.1 cbb3-type cytochrome oxidase assembly protein CcoS [Psychrobacter sp.]
MLSIFLLIPLSLMLFVVAIWAVRYAVKSNQFEDLDNASQRIILDDRQERRQTIQAHEHSMPVSQNDATTATDIIADDKAIHPDDIKSVTQSDLDKHPKI